MKFKLGLKAVAVSIVVLFGLVLGSGVALGMNSECLDVVKSANLAAKKLRKIRSEVELIEQMARKCRSRASEPGVGTLTRFVFTTNAQVLECKANEKNGNIGQLQLNYELENSDVLYKLANHLDGKAPRNDEADAIAMVEKAVIAQEKRERDTKALHEAEITPVIVADVFRHDSDADRRSYETLLKATTLNNVAWEIETAEAWWEAARAWDEAESAALLARGAGRATQFRNTRAQQARESAAAAKAKEDDMYHREHGNR
jgi:hypothetical protein